MIPRAHAHACSAATCRSRTHVHSLALYSSARGCTPSRAVVSASGVGPPACSASCSAEASSPSDELLARAWLGLGLGLGIGLGLGLGFGLARLDGVPAERLGDGIERHVVQRRERRDEELVQPAPRRLAALRPRRRRLERVQRGRRVVEPPLPRLERGEDQRAERLR